MGKCINTIPLLTDSVHTKQMYRTSEQRDETYVGRVRKSGTDRQTGGRLPDRSFTRAASV